MIKKYKIYLLGLSACYAMAYSETFIGQISGSQDVVRIISNNENNCYVYKQHAVITRPKDGSIGQDIVVQELSKNNKLNCKWNKKNIIANVPNASYFAGVYADKYLLLDNGTSSVMRSLLIYDTQNNKKIYTTTNQLAASPAIINNQGILEYWQKITPTRACKDNNSSDIALSNPHVLARKVKVVLMPNQKIKEITTNQTKCVITE